MTLAARGFKGNKAALPQKPCLQCQRPMTWRRAWAKNWAEVIAKGKDVEALPNKTPYDTYVMHQFLGIAYVQMQRYD